MSGFLKWLAVLSAFVVLAACAGNTPEATARTFIEKSYAGDADAAIALLHMPKEGKPGESEMIQGKMKAGIAEQKEKAENNGGVKEVTVQSAEIDNHDPNRANATVLVHFKNGTTETDRVRLIQVDGKWKIFLGGGW